MTTSGLLLASTGLYGGFQWTIRVLVYPQFATVPTDAFVTYEREHQRRVSIAVGPLFAFFGVTSGIAVILHPGVASVVVAGCFALILLTTGLAAVPRHRRLSTGFDPSTHRHLLAVDSVRLALAVTAIAAAAFVGR